ncbi:unnamed protein product [Urochloa humidicola]
MEGRRSRGSGPSYVPSETVQSSRIWSELMCYFQVPLTTTLPCSIAAIIPRAELDTIKGSFLNRHVSEEASDGYNWNLEGIAIFKVRRQDSIYGEKLIDCGWQQKYCYEPTSHNINITASFIDKLLRWLTCEGGEDTMSRVCVVA